MDICPFEGPDFGRGCCLQGGTVVINGAGDITCAGGDCAASNTGVVTEVVCPLVISPDLSMHMIILAGFNITREIGEMSVLRPA